MNWGCLSKNSNLGLSFDCCFSDSHLRVTNSSDTVGWMATQLSKSFFVAPIDFHSEALQHFITTQTNHVETHNLCVCVCARMCVCVGCGFIWSHGTDEVCATMRNIQTLWLWYFWLHGWDHIEQRGTRLSSLDNDIIIPPLVGGCNYSYKRL